MTRASFGPQVAMPMSKHILQLQSKLRFQPLGFCRCCSVDVERRPAPRTLLEVSPSYVLYNSQAASALQCSTGVALQSRVGSVALAKHYRAEQSRQEEEESLTEVWCLACLLAPSFQPRTILTQQTTLQSANSIAT